jgi:hypothetical protein
MMQAADAYFTSIGINVGGGAGGSSAPPSAGSAAPQITQEQIDAYIKQAPPAGPECCKAARDFNDAFCRWAGGRQGGLLAS